MLGRRQVEEPTGQWTHPGMHSMGLQSCQALDGLQVPTSRAQEFSKPLWRMELLLGSHASRALFHERHPLRKSQGSQGGPWTPGLQE